MSPANGLYQALLKLLPLSRAFTCLSLEWIERFLSKLREVQHWWIHPVLKKELRRKEYGSAALTTRSGLLVCGSLLLSATIGSLHRIGNST
jgi:hypothetical protein